MKYEYKALLTGEIRGNAGLDGTLRNWGANGWRLHTILFDQQGVTTCVVFEREA